MRNGRSDDRGKYTDRLHFGWVHNLAAPSIVVSLGNHGRGKWSHRNRQLLYALLGSQNGCTLLSTCPLVLATTGLFRQRGTHAEVPASSAVFGGAPTRGSGAFRHEQVEPTRTRSPETVGSRGGRTSGGGSLRGGAARGNCIDCHGLAWTPSSRSPDSSPCSNVVFVRLIRT